MDKPAPESLRNLRKWLQGVGVKKSVLADRKYERKIDISIHKKDNTIVLITYRFLPPASRCQVRFPCRQDIRCTCCLSYAVRGASRDGMQMMKAPLVKAHEEQLPVITEEKSGWGERKPHRAPRRVQG